MRTAPQAIVTQQERYARGARLWKCLYVLPHFAFMGLWAALLMDPSLKRSLRPAAFVIMGALVSILLFEIRLREGRAVVKRQVCWVAR